MGGRAKRTVVGPAGGSVEGAAGGIALGRGGKGFERGPGRSVVWQQGTGASFGALAAAATGEKKKHAERGLKKMRHTFYNYVLYFGFLFLTFAMKHRFRPKFSFLGLWSGFFLTHTHTPLLKKKNRRNARRYYSQRFSQLLGEDCVIPPFHCQHEGFKKNSIPRKNIPVEKN